MTVTQIVTPQMDNLLIYNFEFIRIGTYILALIYFVLEAYKLCYVIKLDIIRIFHKANITFKKHPKDD